jgi:septum formation protein
MDIVLASTSTYRAELLRKVVKHFTIDNPSINEAQFQQSEITPEKLAIKLAKVKANALINKYPQHLIIGSDQVCEYEGKIFNKPNILETAISQLQEMQGRAHFLHTAVCVENTVTGEHVNFINTTKLWMRKLNLNQIKNYLKLDEPFNCAGSYKLESFGISLFEKIECSDHTAIIGLPLIELTNILLKQGHPLLEE